MAAPPFGSTAPALESCALITTDANEVGAEGHNRMPVILDAANYDAWLDPSNDHPASLQSLLAQFSADRMSARPVSTYVNNAKNQGEQCIAPPI
jgi:putative SOS response-associated peptidase YedK